MKSFEDKKHANFRKCGFFQMRVSLLESDCLVNDDDDDLVEYIASSENNIHQLFSPQQLQVTDCAIPLNPPNMLELFS